MKMVSKRNGKEDDFTIQKNICSDAHRNSFARSYTDDSAQGYTFLVNWAQDYFLTVQYTGIFL